MRRVAEKTALLVVDVQEAAVARGPYRGDEVLRNITSLIAACRAAALEVIYVQHDGEPGFDNGELTARQIYEYHNRRIFRDRFAATWTMSETLEAIG